MKYFFVEPEVAGGLGPRTVMDTSQHPPRVVKLHYEFSGWLGDPILESFPTFIVTEAAEGKLTSAALTGMSFADADISISPTFRERQPDVTLPPFRWMKISGRAGVDDFGIASDNRLVASERALSTLRSCGLDHAVVEAFH
jgi:hypothetical protein